MEFGAPQNTNKSCKSTMKTPVRDTVREGFSGTGDWLRGQRNIDLGSISPAHRRRTSVFRGSPTNRTMQFCHYGGRQANRNSTDAERNDFKIKPKVQTKVRLFAKHSFGTAAVLYLRTRMLTLRGCNARIIFKFTRFNHTRRRSFVYFECGISPLPD